MNTGGGQPPGSSEVCVGFVLIIIFVVLIGTIIGGGAIAVAEPASCPWAAATTAEFNTYDVRYRPAGQHGRRKRRFV